MSKVPPSSEQSTGEPFDVGELPRRLAQLLDIARSCRWVAFDSTVLQSAKVFGALDRVSPEHYEGSTLLHACLCFDPPLDVVAKMVNMLPNRAAGLRAKDRAGRTPLHIAAACGADPHVIKLIGSAEPEACCIVDNNGRTPLSLACNIFCVIGDCGSGKAPRDERIDPPCYGAIQSLLSESLRATLIEDEDGMSPLEHAIMSDASDDVIHLLQNGAMVYIDAMEEAMRHSNKRSCPSNDEPVVSEASSPEMRFQKKKVRGRKSSSV